jgi:hypothetical protein
MTLDFKKARALCTEPEFELVGSSRVSSLRSVTPRLLRLKMARARGLRDKFRDLADRQAREARKKASPRGRRPARGNARTVEKAELFGEVLRRFEGQAKKLDLAGAPASPGGRVARTAKRRPARPVRRARTQRKAADARKEAKLKTSHVPRMRAHVSSRNRRQQPRRDARRSHAE